MLGANVDKKVVILWTYPTVIHSLFVSSLPLTFSLISSTKFVRLSWETQDSSSLPWLLTTNSSPFSSTSLQTGLQNLESDACRVSGDGAVWLPSSPSSASCLGLESNSRGSWEFRWLFSSSSCSDAFGSLVSWSAASRVEASSGRNLRISLSSLVMIVFSLSVMICMSAPTLIKVSLKEPEQGRTLHSVSERQ